MTVWALLLCANILGVETCGLVSVYADEEACMSVTTAPSHKDMYYRCEHHYVFERKP